MQYPQMQQQPSPQEVYSYVERLKQQLINTQGNPQAQWELTNEINKWSQHLNMMSHQQHVRQPVQLQQQYQNQQYQQPFQPVMGGGQLNNGITAGINENSRYAKQAMATPYTPPAPPMQQQYAHQPQQQMHPQPQQQMHPQLTGNAELKPIDGCPFPLLLAKGLNAEIVPLDSYFKYEIHGKETGEYDNRIAKLVDSKYDIVKHELTPIEVLTYLTTVNNITNAIHNSVSYVTVVTPIIPELTEAIKNITGSESLIAIANTLRLKSVSETRAGKILNNLYTKIFNSYFKYVAFSKFKIDDFKEDILEVVNTVVPGITSVDSRKKHQKGLENILQAIVSNKLTMTELGNNFGLLKIRKDVAYIGIDNKHTIIDLLDAFKEETDTSVVTPDSHSRLYEVIDTSYNENEIFKNVGVCVLTHISNTGTGIEYDVYKNSLGTYTVTKPKKG